MGFFLHYSVSLANYSKISLTSLKETTLLITNFSSQKEKIPNKCSVGVYAFLGDMNDNGYLSTLDLVLAQRVILGIDPPSQNSAFFGYISLVYIGVESQLNSFDINIAQQVILGIIPCQ